MNNLEKLKIIKPVAREIRGKHRVIYDFGISDENIDPNTVDSFGEEWQSFHGFTDEEVMSLGAQYFDIITPEMINKKSVVLEVGCGSGRFLKYLADKVDTIVGVDPSDAVFASDDLLGKNDKVVLIKTSANDLPFADESFDFVYSIGVLHHIPDTAKAMQACVDKVKKGGYFFTYLYYDLDNRGILFRSIYNASNVLRKGICRLPTAPKKIVCDVLALGLYMPFVGFSRLLKKVGVSDRVRSKIPLYGYEDKSFYIIRNDALDRFGTPLEQRFTKEQVKNMMESCGLAEMDFSPNIPYWHAVGKKK